LGEIKTVEKVNGGNNSTNLKDIDLAKRPSTSMEGWNATCSSMPNTTPTEAQKSQDVMNPQEKPIKTKEIFLDNAKQMLKIVLL